MRQKQESVPFRFAIAALLVVCMSTIPAFAIASTTPWQAKWRALAETRFLPPTAKQATVRIDFPPADQGLATGGTCSLVLAGRDVGYISIDDGGTVTGFEVAPVPYNGEGVISLDKAREVATDFIHFLIPSPNGEELIHAPAAIESTGFFRFLFEYRVNAVSIRSVDVQVSHDGYVARMGDSDAYRNGHRDLTQELAHLPSKEAIEAAMRRALDEQGSKEAQLDDVHCDMVLPDGKLVFTWYGRALKQVNGEALETEVLCTGDGTQCGVGKWRPPHNHPTWPTLASDPVWCDNGRSLWWDAGVLWRQQPPWSSAIPSSLVHQDALGRTPAVYRPLPEEGPKFTYQLPSLSPDGRWLAFYIYGKHLSAIDLQSNRLYSLGGEGTERVAWNSDSSAIAYVRWWDRQACVRTVTSESGIPFDNQEQVMLFPGEFAAVEFLPGTKNRLIGFFRSKKRAAEQDGWELVTVTVPEQGGNAGMLTVLRNLPRPLRMHAVPGGQQVLVCWRDGMKAVDLNSGAIDPIGWLGHGKSVGDGIVIDYGCFNWDISPDGREIAFSALDTKENAFAIFAASPTGDKLRRISPPAKTVLNRYFAQDRYALVDKATMPLTLLEELGYIKPGIPWPEILPPGPWNRTNPGTPPPGAPGKTR